MLPQQHSSVRKVKLHSNLSKHSSPLRGKSSNSFSMFSSQALTVKNSQGAFYLAPLALLPPPPPCTRVPVAKPKSVPQWHTFFCTRGTANTKDTSSIVSSNDTTWIKVTPLVHHRLATTRLWFTRQGEKITEHPTPFTTHWYCAPEGGLNIFQQEQAFK